MDNEEEKATHNMFHFDKNKKAPGMNLESKREQRRKHFLNDQDADDLKRKREDKTTTLRKDHKKNKFQKNRASKFPGMVDSSDKKGDGKSKGYTIIEAEAAWVEGMDIMEYFHILNKTDFDLSHFLYLMDLILSKEEHKLLFGVVGMRKLLSLIDNPPIQNVIDANLLPVLLSLVGRNDFPRLQFEVLWCLTNIASGKSDHVQALIDKGALPLFISLLGSNHKNIVEQSIWALGNIAGEDAYFKNLILKEGAIKPLGQIFLSAESDSMLARNCAWCITNLLRGKPMPVFEEMMFLIPIIWNAARNNTKKEILIDCLWGISYISDAGEKATLKILECGALETIVDALSNPHNQIVMPAVRALGNFVTGEDTETQTIIDAGVLPLLHGLLSSEDVAIVKEAWWTLSNICAGTANQVAAIIELGIIDMLVTLTQNQLYEIKREAGWCISNTTALKNEEIIKVIVEKQGIEAMCHILKFKVDVKTAVVLLEGIRNILEVGKTHFLDERGENPFTYIVEEWGGLDTIEELQSHLNQHVYELSVEIIENYFTVEEIDLTQQSMENIKLEF